MYPCSYPFQRLFPDIAQDVAILIAAYVDIEGLLKLRALCRSGDQFLAAELYSRSRTMFRGIIGDYEAFVRELHLTCALVGHEAALHIFYPALGSPDEIHLLAPKRLFFHLIAYLVHREQFSLAVPDGSTTARSRYVILSKGGRTVRVVQSQSPSPLQPIVQNWQTALFAYIAPTQFCNPYSPLTSNMQALFHPGIFARSTDLPASTWAQMAIWKKAGWRFSGRKRDSRPGAQGTLCGGTPSPTCAAARRFFGDSHCLSGPTRSLADERVLAMPYDALQEWNVVWWRGGRRCSEECHSGAVEVEPGYRVCSRVLLRV
ncbi:hypothetical protein K466DRAFT_496981 [Polyporus arcularius HHB13444]|uniref:Uncharacterized protein n=1 Tax=Polyporus arcularius HHB13444 TaxID=1314778 RepID=A0A5C3P3J4_9APHY|nr:hypothetical protein K466DRAFT_496981 [Polyporus arcularius HHB13444]